MEYMWMCGYVGYLLHSIRATSSSVVAVVECFVFLVYPLKIWIWMPQHEALVVAKGRRFKTLNPFFLLSPNKSKNNEMLSFQIASSYGDSELQVTGAGFTCIHLEGRWLTGWKTLGTAGVYTFASDADLMRLAGW